MSFGMSFVARESGSTILTVTLFSSFQRRRNRFSESFFFANKTSLGKGALMRVYKASLVNLEKVYSRRGL